MRRAVEAAQAALDGPLRKVNPAKRSALMNTLAELIKANGDELAELESLDNGKPLATAKGDVAASVNHLRYYAGWPTKIEGQTIPVSARDVLCYTLREPVGVCGQIVPWNFPLLMAIWKIAPALAAGCPIVLKPAEQTPLTALRLGELALEAGLPPGDPQRGHGRRRDRRGARRRPWRRQDRVHRLDRRRPRDRAEVRRRRSSGSRSSSAARAPTSSFPTPTSSQAIKGSFQGIYFNSGQACNAGSRLFVARELFDEVTERLASYAGEAKVGPGLDPESEFGPLVSAGAVRARQGLHRLRARRGRERPGGRLTGERRRLLRLPHPLHRVSDEMKIAREEIFGPVLVAMPFDELEEVAARANDTEYGLAAGLWTRDISNAHKLAAMLKAGTSTSTPGAAAIRRRRSAGTRRRGSAARRAT